MCKDTWVDVVLDWMRENRLHPIIDLFLSYIFAIVCILYYVVYYVSSNDYCVQRIKAKVFFLKHNVNNNNNDNNNSNNISVPRIPIMTEVRTELRNVETELIKTFTRINEGILQSYETMLESKMITMIRNDEQLRRLVSKFMTLHQSLYKLVNYTGTMPTNDDTHHRQQQLLNRTFKLYKILDNIWIKLLSFPPLDYINMKNNEPFEKENRNESKTINEKTDFVISLILPAYKESGKTIAHILAHSLQNCTNPHSVQVIIAHSNGTCPDLPTFVKEYNRTAWKDEHTICNGTRKQLTWGQVQIVNYVGSGGRGSCMNYGARSGTGHILTFLHCDTLLPLDWDLKIIQALFPPVEAATAAATTKIPHACTFRYGIDTSSKGLGGMKYPLGIHSVTILGRLRAYLCQHPYGDHVISIPSTYFWYIGGYPNQSIMEDYDLMDLLRQRALLSLTSHGRHHHNQQQQEFLQKEGLIIIPGEPVLCSPRRWQKFGVAYVTAVNAVLVYRYVTNQFTTNDIFDYYYQRPFRRTRNNNINDYNLQKTNNKEE